MTTDVAAAASYLVAAIAEATDRQLAEEVLDAITDLLPYHLALDNIYNEEIA